MSALHDYFQRLLQQHQQRDDGGGVDEGQQQMMQLSVLRSLFYDYSLEVARVQATQATGHLNAGGGGHGQQGSQAVHALAQLSRRDSAQPPRGDLGDQEGEDEDGSSPGTDADDERRTSTGPPMLQLIPAIRVQKKIHALYNQPLPSHIINLQVKN